MAWRVIDIGNPAQISLKNGQLIIKQGEEVSLPIEDIDSLILDSYGINITANLLTELAQKGTTVVVCDSKHLPASLILPYSQHSRQAKISRQQIAMNQPLKKRLWRKIIIQKIVNQAVVLREFDYDGQALFELAKVVRSGDTTNRESQAARLYFSLLLNDETRRKPIWYNAALNYSYALVRSSLARHIAARGLIASQGVFHRSELNSFNLADDLIESFRPIVDEYVLARVAPFHFDGPGLGLSKQDKERIVDIFNYSAIISGKKLAIKYATERLVESFVQSIESQDENRLLLPELLTK